MNIGDLRNRVTIQRYDTTRDEAGQEIPDWKDLATVWASVQPLQGRERFIAQQVQASLSHKVTIRYNRGWYTEWSFVTQNQIAPIGDQVKVSPKLRLVFDGRVLEINAVIDIEERHRFLELHCSEVI
jgi:SPP1 family predicted phage head-tail adaptor